MIGATTTKAGLNVECTLDTRTYEKGIKISDIEMKRLDLTGICHIKGPTAQDEAQMPFGGVQD